MPGAPTEIGLVYFAGVKLAGYTAAGFGLNQLAGSAKPNPALFGLTRTACGRDCSFSPSPAARGHTSSTFRLSPRSSSCRVAHGSAERRCGAEEDGEVT